MNERNFIYLGRALDLILLGLRFHPGVCGRQHFSSALHHVAWYPSTMYLLCRQPLTWLISPVLQGELLCGVPSDLMPRDAPLWPSHYPSATTAVPKPSNLSNKLNSMPQQQHGQCDDKDLATTSRVPMILSRLTSLGWLPRLQCGYLTLQTVPPP